MHMYLGITNSGQSCLSFDDNIILALYTVYLIDSSVVFTRIEF